MDGIMALMLGAPVEYACTCCQGVVIHFREMAGPHPGHPDQKDGWRLCLPCHNTKCQCAGLYVSPWPKGYWARVPRVVNRHFSRSIDGDKTVCGLSILKYRYTTDIQDGIDCGTCRIWLNYPPRVARERLLELWQTPDSEFLGRRPLGWEGDIPGMYHGFTEM